MSKMGEVIPSKVQIYSSTIADTWKWQFVVEAGAADGKAVHGSVGHYQGA